MKRTKIICTIGPSCADVKTITELIKQGMNVARLNFSHGSYENHANLIKNIRTASAKLGVPVAILQDLQGPKIRIGSLAQPYELKDGAEVVVGKDLPMDFDISKSVSKGQRILIEDGLMELMVEKVKDKHIHCRVVNGGTVKSHKGVNLPDSVISFPIITKKDKADLEFGMSQDVDFVALSFVRNSEDVRNLKDLILSHAVKKQIMPKVIAKIERREAVDLIDSIIQETDGVMVARGDLGVEIADSEVPVIQKMIIRKCLAAAKPVIVATQMLDSMIRNPRPTRAEVSDVANAVIDHTDAVMLSGETAFGDYPVQAVAEMRQIIEVAEKSDFFRERCQYLGEEEHASRSSKIAEAVRMLAEGVDAHLIVGTTETGFTGRFISRERPDTDIIILTDRDKVYRQMCLLWGVTPLFVNSLKDLKDIGGLLGHFIAEAKKQKLVKKHDKAVLVAGNPLGQRMNVVQVVTI